MKRQIAKATAVSILLILISILISFAFIASQTPKKVSETEIKINNKKLVIKDEIDVLKPNTYLKFTPGQQLYYETSLIPISGEGYYFEKQKFMVKGIRIINGSRYFEVQRIVDYYIYNPVDNITLKIGNRTNTWYYNAKNGYCIGKNINPERFSDEDVFSTDASMFSYWMLGLREGAKWTMRTITAEKGKRETLKTRYNFEVLGRDVVDGRKCFKIKATITDEAAGKVKETRYYWVDVKDRILVKLESYSGKNKNFEIKLVGRE